MPVPLRNVTAGRFSFRRLRPSQERSPGVATP
jgi:hypothetical protein